MKTKSPRKTYSITSAILLALAVNAVATTHHITNAKAAYNYDIATVTKQPFTQLYGDSGNKTNIRLAYNTDWRVLDIQQINGQQMYLVGNHVWLASSDSANNFTPSKYNYHVARVIAPKTHYANVYDRNGNKIYNRLLPDFSDWRTDQTKKIGNDYYYQVSTNEWLRADNVVTNFAYTNNANDNNENANNNNQSNNNNATQNNPFDAYATQKAIVNEINRLRAMNNLNPLQVSNKLSQFSMQRAQNLASAGQLDGHAGAYGELYPNEYALVTENIGEDYLQPTPEQNAIESTKNYFHEYGSYSDGHRKNLLNPFVTEIGVGAASDNNGTMYTVETIVAPFSVINSTNSDALDDYLNSPAPTGVYDH